MTRKRILAIICLAALSACRMSTPVAEPMVSTDKGIYQIGSEGGDITVNIVSTVQWTAAIAPGSSRDDVSDFSVFPTSGPAGRTTLTVHMGKNAEHNRSAVISLTSDFTGSSVKVEQTGDKGPLVEQISIEKFLEQPDDNTVFFILTGKITKVTQSNKYSNFYLNDGTGEVYVYGLYDGQGGPQFTDGWLDNNGVNVGWHFTIGATRGSYKGTPEGMLAYPIEWSEPTDPMLSCDTPSVNLLCTETTATFSLKALNLEEGWTVTPVKKLDWVTQFTQTGTASGDITVTVAANTGMKQRTAEFLVTSKGAKDLKLTVVQAGKTDVEALTIAEFLAKPVDPDIFYELTGRVKQIIDDPDYSNFYLEDATGSVYVAGVFESVGGKEYADGWLSKNKVSVGSVLKIWASRGDWGAPLCVGSVVKEIPIPTPALKAEPVSVTIAAADTQATFAVTCEYLTGGWMLQADEAYPWVVEYSAEGTASATVTIVVQPNTGAQRTATFTLSAPGVAPIQVTLIQAAQS